MIYILHPSANQITWSQSPNSRPLESSNHSPSFDTPPPKSDISQIFWPVRYTAMYWRDIKWTLSVLFKIPNGYFCMYILFSSLCTVWSVSHILQCSNVPTWRFLFVFIPNTFYSGLRLCIPFRMIIVFIFLFNLYSLFLVYFLITN